MKTPATPSAAAIDADELFGRLPPGRCGEADRQYLDEVLDDGFGNKESADMLQRFERAFAETFGVEYAISHNSGSGTMLSCLLAAGVGPGDEVIVPSCTMAATAFVVIECGPFRSSPTAIRTRSTSPRRALKSASRSTRRPSFR